MTLQSQTCKEISGSQLVGFEGFTLGTCPNQSCLHEQEALNRILIPKTLVEKWTLIGRQTQNPKLVVVF